MLAQLQLSFDGNTAFQWASAACSRLVSRFRSFFTSRDGSPASPLRLQVADEFPVVIDVPPPGDTECMDLVSPPGQPAAATQPRRSRISIWGFAPDPAHPIVVLFQSQELGKAAIGLVMPTITSLLFNQNHHPSYLHASLMALALCIGFTAAWMGLTLRGVWPRVATTLENFGAVSIFAAFFGLEASFLPPSLAWVSWLCCALSCLPFLLCMKPLSLQATGSQL